MVECLAFSLGRKRGKREEEGVFVELEDYCTVVLRSRLEICHRFLVGDCFLVSCPRRHFPSRVCYLEIFILIVMIFFFDVYQLASDFGSLES